MFIYYTGTKNIRRLHLSSVDDDRHGIYSGSTLAWSPDSKSLIVAGYSKRLFLIDEATRQSTPLTDASGTPIQGAYPSFSPDGSQIAFCCQQSLRRFPDINVYDLATRQVTTIAEGFTPHWSRTNKLVYIRDGVYVRDLVSQQEQKLPPIPGIESPRWSPDGTKLVYSAAVHICCVINVYDLDSGRNIRLTGGLPDSSPEWSPTGDQIVWTRSTNEPPTGEQSHIMNVDGTQIRRLFSEDYIGSKRATWSPDGKKIAFIAPTGVDNSDILVFDFRKGLSNVTKHLEGRQSNPSWSPNRTSLAFSGWSVETQFEFNKTDIYELKLDSGVAKTILASPTEAEGCPAWSPIGSQLAYTVRDHGTAKIDNLILALSDGSSRRLPIPAKHQTSCGVWSPDGQYIAFEVAGPPDNGIALLDMSTGAFETVVIGARKPTWATDSDKLYFVKSTGGFSQEAIMRFSVADRTISLVANVGDYVNGMGSFVVSPDGRYIVTSGMPAGMEIPGHGLFIYDTVDGTRKELVSGFNMYSISDVVWAR